MKIKLTKRGRFVVVTLLVIGVAAAVGFSIYLVALASAHTSAHANPPVINCVADTVLQPDGSCTPMEV